MAHCARGDARVGHANNWQARSLTLNIALRNNQSVEGGGARVICRQRERERVEAFSGVDRESPLLPERGEDLKLARLANDH